MTLISIDNWDINKEMVKYVTNDSHILVVILPF